MNFSCSDDVFLYFESFTNLEKSMSFSEREYRLDRMQYLLENFDNPQQNYKIIHIAGSKGKGSTATICSSILTSLGYKTGLFTSPHLLTYKERITHAGVFIDEKVLIACGSSIKAFIEKGKIPFPDPPTTFELLTLFAFLIFKETGCQWAVIETGIGGRLDATNTIIPEASVICPIELEHTDILGDTIEKITYEKSGIIKQNKPVFVSRQKETVLDLIRKTAEERLSSLFILDEHINLENISVSRKGTVFELISGEKRFEISINLPGVFQAFNTALALLTINNILNIEYSDIIPHLHYIPLKGRIEIIQLNNMPDIIIDSSHTPESAAVLAETLKNIYKDKGILIFGSVNGKDHIKMLDKLAPLFEDILVSKPGTFKKSSPENVFIDLKMKYPKKNIILETDAEKAFINACNYSGGKKYIVVSGSFYMASEIKKLL